MSKLKKVGDKCKNCNSTVVLKKRSNRQKTGSYYYTHFLWCNSCKSIYFLDKYKVYQKAPKTKVPRQKQKKISNTKRISKLEEQVKFLMKKIELLSPTNKPQKPARKFKTDMSSFVRETLENSNK